jgi:hypothetical protein
MRPHPEMEPTRALPERTRWSLKLLDPWSGPTRQRELRAAEPSTALVISRDTRPVTRDQFAMRPHREMAPTRTPPERTLWSLSLLDPWSSPTRQREPRAAEPSTAPVISRDTRPRDPGPFCDAAASGNGTDRHAARGNTVVPKAAEWANAVPSDQACHGLRLAVSSQVLASSSPTNRSVRGFQRRARWCQ